VCEPHLDLLALTLTAEAVGACERPGNVSGVLMDVSGILRDGSFGQHWGLSGHTSQSSLLAQYRSVLPSCTVPLVPSRFPPRKSMREKVPSSRFDLSNTGICGAINDI